jgi:hypothetical protein
MRDVLKEVNQKMQCLLSPGVCRGWHTQGGSKNISPLYRVAVRAFCLTRDSISGRQ